MSLIQLVLTLVIVGFSLWVINTYIPMNGNIKNILNVVVIVVVILYLLRGFGALDSVFGLRIGR